MIYMILSVICMSMLILSIKIAGIRGANTSHVAFLNYVVALIITICMNLAGNKFAIFSELGSLDVHTVFTEKTIASTAFIILVMGIISGISFPTNLVEVKDSTSVNGSAITAFFKQMSTIGGLLIAIIFMGERPNGIQWVGMFLMVIAIGMMVIDFKSLKINNGLILILILITGALMETGNKVISRYTIEGYSMVYLSVIFFVGMIFMVIYLMVKEGKGGFRFSWKDLIYGSILGLSNIGNNFFKIQALNELSAAVVIPVVAAGSLIITNCVGIFFFKEKANKLYGIAVIVAIVSIFLLNI